jgi:mannitol/fructose-specific phosphotransferase system IIA component (Ntr-type)
VQATLVPSALDSSLIIPDLRHRRRETALAEIVARAAEAGAVRSREAFLDLLAAREALVSEALGRSCALIGARSLAVPESRLVLARSRRGIAWDAPDLAPVHLVALLLSTAERSPSNHVTAMVRVATLLRQPRNRHRLLEADSAEALAAAVREVFS